MGSGLSQVAILSEVAKTESALIVGEHLNEIADLARSMRDSIGDIVWAVDPRRDTLADLIQRMKQVAFNLLEADGLRVEFHAPEEQDLARVNLAPDRRRHLLLIFKETVNNIARHARASHVRIEIRLEPNRLHLCVEDDGCGFDTKAEYQGHGLRSVRQRASELGAISQTSSTPGAGTTVQITVPLKHA
jgi:signal transduction histidine kinase